MLLAYSYVMNAICVFLLCGIHGRYHIARLRLLVSAIVLAEYSGVTVVVSVGERAKR